MKTDGWTWNGIQVTSFFTYSGYEEDNMVVKEGDTSRSVYGFKIKAIKTEVQVHASVVLGRTPEKEEAYS